MEENDLIKGTIRGFYLDHQLSNPLTRVSLHPNLKIKDPNDTSKPKKDDNKGEEKKPIDFSQEITWCEFSDDEIDEEEKDLGKNIEGYDYYPYSKEPIAVSLLNEDFQVDIANNWGESGGDPLGSFWNSTKGLAPYVSEFQNALKKIRDKEKKRVKGSSSDWKEKAHDYLEAGTKAMSNYFSDKGGARLMNRGLSVQGTQFSFYGGTGISFGNMNMKFTIFPEYGLDENNNPKLITVKEKLDKFMPYCIGPFIPVDIKKDFYKEASEDVQSFGREFAHWQLPPGGYEPYLKNIDVIQKGTLKLVIGGYYSLTNLVVSGCSLSMSKVLIKNPLVDMNNINYMTPMSCDVSLNLKPASRYSYVSLMKFIEGRATTTLRTAIASNINKSFEKSIEHYKSGTGDFYV